MGGKIEKRTYNLKRDIKNKIGENATRLCKAIKTRISFLQMTGHTVILSNPQRLKEGNMHDYVKWKPQDKSLGRKIIFQKSLPPTVVCNPHYYQFNVRLIYAWIFVILDVIIVLLDTSTT
jgi:hypothetical protein